MAAESIEDLGPHANHSISPRRNIRSSHVAITSPSSRSCARVMAGNPFIVPIGSLKASWPALPSSRLMPVLFSKISVRLYQKAGLHAHLPRSRSELPRSRQTRLKNYLIKDTARFAGIKNSHDVWVALKT